jgi:hypothetical protein
MYILLKSNDENIELVDVEVNEVYLGTAWDQQLNNSTRLVLKNESGSMIYDDLTLFSFSDGANVFSHVPPRTT